MGLVRSGKAGFDKTCRGPARHVLAGKVRNGAEGFGPAGSVLVWLARMARKVRFRQGAF